VHDSIFGIAGEVLGWEKARGPGTLSRLDFNEPPTAVGGIRLRWRWGYFGNLQELA
jgi:hypothetical protein